MKLMILYRFLFCFTLIILLPSPVKADPFLVSEEVNEEALGPVIENPICFNVLNKAPYSVFGTIQTAEYVRSDGIKTRHRSNFRIETNHMTEFCSRGPFFEGQKLEIILKSLVPIFSCKTKITGDLIVQGETKPEGGTKTWVDCIN